MLAVAPGHLGHLRSASRAASLLLAPAWRTPGWRESLQRPAKLNSSSLLLRNTPKRIVTPPAHALHRWGLQLVKKSRGRQRFQPQATEVCLRFSTGRIAYATKG